MKGKNNVLPTAAHKPKGLKDSSAVLFGRHGLGKTYLLTTFARALIVDLEGGSRMMEATAIEPSSWAELLGWIDKLEVDDHDFDTVAIDTADRAWAMLEESVCKELGVKAVGDAARGKGWAMMKTRWSRFVYRLINLRAGDGRKILPFFLCHEKLVPMTERRGETSIETGRTLVSVNLPNSGKLILLSAVDFVFHLFIDEKSGKRFLRTQATDTAEFRIEAKGRGAPGCALPPVIHAHFGALCAEFDKAFNNEGEQTDAI